MQKYLLHDAQANERKQKGCISTQNFAWYKLKHNGSYKDLLC